MPARRAARLFRFGPVLRDLGGALVEVAARLLERLRHGGVHARPPLAQLRARGHLLRQRVLEGILDLWIERRLEQELRRDQRRERLPQRRLVDRGDAPEDAPQQRLAERLADHRGGLQHLLLPLRQAIDARRQHACTVAGTSRASTGVVNRYAPRAPAR